MKKLNIGMIGYGFMGRTHSNAFSQVNHFFDVPYQPVLKTLCARNAERGAATAASLAYPSSVAVDAMADEYFTGLMERVVDGPQRLLGVFARH